MKKFILALTFASFSLTASAAHGPAGCGFGTLIFKGQSGLAMNVLAGITNTIFWNQTFAMSTGTLECGDAKNARVGAISFIDNNMVALSTDIATGEGESLDAYLALVNLEVTSEGKAHLQQNFDKIFVEGANAEAIHTNILTLLVAKS